MFFLEAIGLYAVIPLLLADFLSGVFHWLEDRYGNPEWPVIGPLVVRPNLEHHTRPAALCEGGYWNRNNTTIIASLIGVALFWWCIPVAIAFVILSQANEVHSWAHQKSNRLIRGLQWIGLLQSCQHHRIHHQRPFDRYYCVMTNYLNGFLSVVKFWQAIEWVVWIIIGKKPRPDRAIA